MEGAEGRSSELSTRSDAPDKPLAAVPPEGDRVGDQSTMVLDEDAANDGANDYNPDEDEQDDDGPTNSANNILPPNVRKNMMKQWGMFSSWASDTMTKINENENVKAIKEKTAAVVKPVVDTTSEYVKPAVAATAEAVKPAWNSTTEVAAQTWVKTKETTGPMWEKTKETTAPMWEATKEGVSTAAVAVKDGATNAMETAKPALESGWKSLSDGVSTMSNAAVAAATGSDPKNTSGDSYAGYSDGSVPSALDGATRGGAFVV